MKISGDKKMKTNILPLPIAIGLLVGLVLIVGMLQSGGTVSAADQYREIYAMDTLAGKRRRMTELSPAVRRDVWRLHFENVRSSFDIDAEQSGVMDRFLDIQRRADRDAMSELEAEALAAFDDSHMRFAVFATIGPYRSVGQFCMPTLWQRVTASFTTHAQEGGCPCSIGSSFNMSCTNECGRPGGACSTTEDGCGFGWMFACDGNCATQAS
jgi:hypothetical protein